MSNKLETRIIAYNDDLTTDKVKYQTFMHPFTDFGQRMLERFDEVGRDYDELVRRQDVEQLIKDKISNMEDSTKKATSMPKALLQA